MVGQRHPIARALLATAPALLLLGCQTLLRAPEFDPRSAAEADRLIAQGRIVLPSAAAPSGEPGTRALHPGDSFTYDNPNETWSVVEVSSREIVWRSATGGRRVTPYEPGLPAVLWNDDKRVGRRVLKSVSGTLLPPAPGKRIDFLVEGQSDRPPARWSARWSCEVKDLVDLTLKAGKAKAYPIECRRNGTLETVYYYFEKVGNYVYVESFQSGVKKARQLTDYKASPQKPPES